MIKKERPELFLRLHVVPINSSEDADGGCEPHEVIILSSLAGECRSVTPKRNPHLSEISSVVGWVAFICWSYAGAVSGWTVGNNTGSSRTDASRFELRDGLGAWGCAVFHRLFCGFCSMPKSKKDRHGREERNLLAIRPVAYWMHPFNDKKQAKIQHRPSLVTTYYRHEHANRIGSGPV